MPVMDGIGLPKVMRRDPQMRAAPAIVVAA
jgi:CheY-like chemotaxis protein